MWNEADSTFGNPYNKPISLGQVRQWNDQSGLMFGVSRSSLDQEGSMIRHVDYFEKPGRGNTVRCQELVAGLVPERYAHVVVASASGENALVMARTLQGTGSNKSWQSICKSGTEGKGLSWSSGLSKTGTPSAATRPVLRTW
jgi:hypothetical protein